MERSERLSLERGYLLRELRETEKAEETCRERDGQIETEEFKTGEREVGGDIRKTSWESFSFSFSSACQAVSLFSSFPRLQDTIDRSTL